MQQDPYQQFASPYVALGGDPINMIDPSGGWSLSAFLGISKIGVAAVTTFVGYIAGGAATAGSGNAKGAIIGAFIGLASNFVGSIGGAVLHAVLGVGNEVIKKEIEKAMPTVAPTHSRGGPNNGGGPNRGSNPIESEENKVGPGDLFNSIDAAAIGFYSAYKESLKKLTFEVSAVIYQLIGEDHRLYFGYTAPESLDDNEKGLSPGMNDLVFKIPQGAMRVSHIHYHSSSDSWDPYNPDNEDFSGPDKAIISALKISEAYVITPTFNLY